MAAIAAGASHGAAKGASASGCFVKAPSLNATKTKVVAGGYCLVRGKRMSATLKYGVSQEDSGRYPCGKTLTGSGSSAPLSSGIYRATATFQAVSRTKVGGKYLRSKPVTKVFVIGGNDWQCGKLDPGNPPTASVMCDQRANPQILANCGRLFLMGTSGSSASFPMWGSMPLVVGQEVLAPSILSPSGSCRGRDAIPSSTKGTMMGLPVHADSWRCSDGWFVPPELSLYFYPSDGSASCSFVGRTSLLYGGELSRFSLPKDSADWGGQLNIVWRMQPNKGGDTASMISVKVISFHGSNNACSELGVHNSG
jgi:hypothetical protein